MRYISFKFNYRYAFIMKITLLHFTDEEIVRGQEKVYQCVTKIIKPIDNRAGGGIYSV